MVDLTRRDSLEVPFQDTGVRGMPVDRSIETAAKAITGLVNTVAPVLEERKNNRILFGFSSDLDEASLSSSAIESVGLDAETELGPEDKNLINQIANERDRVNLQVEQGLLTDRAARTKLLAIGNAFISANPHLAPEADKLFKIRTGRGIGEEALAMREESLDAALQEKQRINTGIVATSKLYNIPTSLPISTQLELQRPFVQANLNLNLLVAANMAADEQEKGNKRSNDQKIATQVPEMLIIVAGSIQGIIANIDPRTATDDEKRNAVLQLNNLRLGVFADSQQQFGLTHSAEELASSNKSVLDLIDNRIGWVDGTVDKALVESTEAVLTGTARNNLLRKPGVAALIAKMAALKDVAGLVKQIPALAAGLKLAGLANPAIELTRAITEPGTVVKTPPPEKPQVTDETPNWYDRLLNTLSSAPGTDGLNVITTVAGEAAAISHIRDFSFAVQSNWDNDETSEILLDAMAKYTNGWQRTPSEVPMDVYDAFLDIVADDRWIKFKNAGLSADLPNNLVAGFDAATQRMRNSLAGEIGETLRVPLDLREVGGQMLIGEMLKIDIADDGALLFLPQPGLEKDTNVLKASAALSRKYGTFFGKLARSYAHEVQGDTDYASAAATILTTGEFRRAGTGFGEETPTNQTPEPEVQVWVRDESGRLVRESK